jgi:ribose 1,5-bisphosphokinase
MQQAIGGAGGAIRDGGRNGRIYAVVGPSGVGKDALLAAVARRCPDLRVMRRAITRPAGPGEQFDTLTPETFADRQAGGGFALCWQAHGLSYGIPASAHDHIAAGGTVVFNGSRAALAPAARVFPALHVVAISARPEVLAARLAARGRETPQDIQRRLDRAALPLVTDCPVTRIDNSGPLEQGVARLIALFTTSTTGLPT